MKQNFVDVLNSNYKIIFFFIYLLLFPSMFVGVLISTEPIKSAILFAVTGFVLKKSERLIGKASNNLKS